MEHTHRDQTPRFDLLHGDLASEMAHLRKLARWYTRNADEADDLVQDTLVLALRFIHTYREGTNMRAWLTRVMRNRHVSVLRRRQLERRVQDTEWRHSLKDWSVGASTRRANTRGGDVDRDVGFSDPVVRALDGLKDEFREAVWLCDVEGLSYAEAARQMGCPVGTIMSRLHRGRRALRRELGSRGALETAA